MEATRARLGAALEWILAGACIAAAFIIASLVVREMRSVSATVPVIAGEAPPASPPAGLPGRAVSVPMLLLPGDKTIRVGETVAAVAARLGRNAEVGAQTVESARFGERLTRFYEHQGTRFVLVFEPFERGGDPRVAAIYLQ